MNLKAFICFALLIIHIFASVDLTFDNSSISRTNYLEDLEAQENSLEEQRQIILQPVPKKIYAFSDPSIANQLLDQLDVFEAVEDGAIKNANYTTPAGGFTINNNYCKDHRAYFTKNAQRIFKRKTFMTNYYHQNRIRHKVIWKLGKDLHKDIGLFRPKHLKDQFLVEMSPEINVFFTHDLFYYLRQPGKQFSCLTQASNHIPGHDKIYRKDHVGQALVDYAKSYESRPTCFNFDKYFPKTWLLQDADQCLNFFEEFNSPYYQQLKQERGVVYFRKIGADVHEGQGVFPITEEEEQRVRALYKNGSLCGKIMHNNLIQYNVYNPLLLENRKFGFRYFMLIASTNPVIAYYHEGYLRLSLDEYNPLSKEIKTFVTNIGLNLKEAEKDEAFKGMTPKEIQIYTTWFSDKLQGYLLEKGVIRDPDWLNNYLRPEFKKVMIHLIRMSQDAYFKKSSLFELLGLDFVMDDKLQLWFIEANTMPLIDGFTPESVEMMNTMLKDMFDIIFALLRARTKRIVNYINQVIATKNKDVAMNLEEPELSERRAEFAEISKNKFDSEFKVRANNTFHTIIDENDIGIGRYAGLLAEECL